MNRRLCNVRNVYTNLNGIEVISKMLIHLFRKSFFFYWVRKFVTKRRKYLLWMTLPVRLLYVDAKMKISSLSSFDCGKKNEWTKFPNWNERNLMKLKKRNDPSATFVYMQICYRMQQSHPQHVWLTLCHFRKLYA